jgi:thiamine-monophosphate kinase
VQIPPLDERGAISWIAEHAPRSPGEEVWIGDDTAVVRIGSESVLFATDSVVEGVHVLPGEGFLFDVGWKALVRNLSDIAAMGGTPTHAVVAVSGASEARLGAIYEGLFAASSEFCCPIVGGDLSEGPSIVVTVSVLGTLGGGAPVVRSGATVGDHLFVTGALGAAGAGLRALLADPSASGSTVDAHRHPVPRLTEGRAARSGGATAMLDLSDGLGIDLHRLADASSVGFALDAIPIAHGATIDDARSGGEDYALLFAAPAPESIATAFSQAGCPPPIRIGTVVEAGERTFAGIALGPLGWEHRPGTSRSSGLRRHLQSMEHESEPDG